MSAPIFRVERCNTVNELLDEILKANLILKGELYDEIRLIFDDYFYAILTGIDNTIIETTDLTSG
ncbi:MAG: hypothetical protein IJS54_06595 [Desulfovibrio sp.]|nr:hypothetical protein [Desulfovibrio sp.]